VISSRDCVSHLYKGLAAVQTRGYESAGIAVYTGQELIHKARDGIVGEALPQDEIDQLSGVVGVGQVRYATAGGPSHPKQPVLANTKFGQIAIVHNGNMVNYDDLAGIAGTDGYNEKPSDTQLFARILEKTDAPNIEEAIKKALDVVKPTYSLIIQHEDTLYAMRDQHGNRPLYIGKLKGGYMLGSEERALRSAGALFIEEVNAGEFIKLSKEEKQSSQIYNPDFKRCIFELIYLASAGDLEQENPRHFGRDLRRIRVNSGVQLWEEHPVVADIVIGILGSGFWAANGYSHASKIPYANTALRINPDYDSRTFIQPTQQLRELGVEMKFETDETIINGKRVVLIDDTEVRGTTLWGLMKMLRLDGASEVHLRIAAPPVTDPCFYGVDFPSKSELIAGQLTKAERLQYHKLRYSGVDFDRREVISMVKNQNLGDSDLRQIVEMSIDEGKNFLASTEDFDPSILNFDGVTLGHLSIEGLAKSFEIDPSEYCMACFTGIYEIEREIVDELLEVT
jgi:amidophosphoribosyltransferase